MKNIRNFLIVITLLVGFNQQSAAQCEVTAAWLDTICAGDSVKLKSSGSCGFLMNNDFNNLSIGSGWFSTAANPVFTNPCGPGPNGAYLWVGTTASNQRTLVTDTFDVSITGCSIKWFMRYGEVSGSGNCEDPDATNEGVHLQYSTNYGATWTDFPGPNIDPVGPNTTNPPFITNTVGSGGYWEPDGVPPSPPTQSVYYWHEYENMIPNVASTTHTSFRWAQLATSSTGYDAWGIDEVEITCPTPDVNVLWSTGDTVFDPGWVTLPQHPQNIAYDTCFTVHIWDSLNPTGGYDTVCAHVIPNPDASFTLSDTVVCEGDSITLTYNGNSIPGASFTWTIDTNKYYTQGPITVSYGPGTYQSKLVINQGGCKDGQNVIKDLTFSPKPFASFNLDPFNGCEPLIVDFTDFSNPNITTWQWDFGNGNTSTQQNPTETFSQGTYDVSLFVETDAGCKDSIVVSGAVTSYPQPDAQFDAVPDVVTIEDPTISFTDMTSNPSSWSWDFGDGNTSTDQNPTHTYSSGDDTPGSYTVMLIASNQYGCADTAYQTVEVVVDKIIIPNVITPNNDNRNDAFKIENIDYMLSSKLVIFNRWGKKVYEATNYKNDNAWDAENLADGVYYYVLEYETYFETKTISGSVTVLRK